MIDWLPVDILLGTLYIYRCIRYILPMESQTVPVQTKHVAIFSVINDDEDAQGVDSIQVKKARKDSVNIDLIPDQVALYIRVARQKTIS